MEAANGNEAVNETTSSLRETATPTFEYPANMEGARTQTDSMSEESDLSIRHDLEIRGQLQISAEFDPSFRPENAPRIALLCQTCYTALQTASLLTENEKLKQQLTSEALRVRVWGMDMFESSISTPLDELLGLVPGNHTSLRCHLVGVWADIAATLETMLCLLLRQPGKLNPENYTPWRRLRVVIGLDDISAAISEGFSLPGTFDWDEDFRDDSEVLSSLIANVGELIECLFDLLVTIGTIRQLHKLGFESNTSSQPNIRAINDQKADNSRNAAEASSTLSSPAINVLLKADPSPTLESDEGQRMYPQATGAGPTDSKSSHLSNSALQDISRRSPGEPTKLSLKAVHHGSLEPQTESAGQKALPEILSMKDSPIAQGKKSRKWVETSSGASVAKDSRFLKPIKFIDCHGRKFTFPFSKCRTWTGMQSLIKEGFQGLTGPYADTTREFIEQGKYDLVSHFNNENIMPSLWSSTLEPGMTVRMMLYQLPPVKQPRAYSYYGTRYTDPSFEYFPFASGSAFNSFSNPRVHGSVDDATQDDLDEPILEQEGSRNVDPETASAMSVTLVQKAEASSPKVDASRSTNDTSSEIKENLDRTSYDDKSNEKTTKSSVKSENLRAADEVELFYSPQSRRRYRAVPSSSNLPRFGDLKIERRSRGSAAHPTSRRDFAYPIGPAAVPTSYIDSAVGGMDSTVSSYIPAPSYTSQPDGSVIDSEKLTTHRRKLPVKPKSAARSLTDLPDKPPAPPQYSDRSQEYLELKQLFLDEKAARQASDFAAKKLEEERRVQVEKELLATKKIAASVVAVAAANERAELARKEAEKLAMEEGRAQAETKRRVAAVAAADNPEPVHFEDCRGWKFTFPYQHCSTWQGMDYLISSAFLNNDTIKPLVSKGRYDLLDPDGYPVPPALWESMVEPGWRVTMKLWPVDGLLNDDPRVVEIITSASTSDSQALENMVNNHSTPPRLSEQSIPALEDLQKPGNTKMQGQPSSHLNVEGTITAETGADTSRQTSDDGDELSGEVFEHRGKISKLKHRVLRPLRARKLTAARRDLESE